MLRNMSEGLRENMMEEGNTRAKFSKCFEKTSSFPLVHVMHQLVIEYSVSPCTDTHVHHSFAAGYRSGERAQMGCRECSSKDPSSRLALDSSHSIRLHKHRGCREEREEMFSLEARFFSRSFLRALKHLTLWRCSLLD